jgi:hypothetical protein
MAIIYNPTVLGTCGKDFFGSVTLTITGGTPPYNVNWLSPNLGIDTGVLSSTRYSITSNDYIVEITDSSFPTNEIITITLPIKDNVCCSIDSITNTSCGFDNGSIVASTNSVGSVSGFTLFSNNNDVLQTIETSFDNTSFFNLSSGTYYVVAFNTFGCSGSSETFVINESTELNYGLYVVPNSNCGFGNFGKIFITGLTGTPPYTYEWSNGQTGNTITGLTEGNYSVKVTDGLGCNSIKSTTVQLVEPLTLASINSIAPTCLQNNGSITFQFTGGTLPYYYSTSNGIYNITFSNSITLSNLESGTYVVDVTDASLCTVSTTTVLNTPSGMTSVDVFTTNSICSKSNGSLTVVLRGGNSPFTYTLVYPDSNTNSNTNSSNSYLFSNLSAGTYTLIVNDSSGCTFTNEYVIVSDFVFDIDVNSSGTTFGKNNGQISVTKTSGGTLPFTYILDGKEIYSNTILSSVTFYNVSSGQHQVKVVDNQGCSETKNIFVTNQPIVNFFLYYTSDGTISGNSLNALISDGQPPFTFNWSNNVFNNPQSITVTGLTAGTYSLTVVDSNGSSMKQEITIPGITNFVSYNIFTVGQQEFQQIDNTKYSLSKMMNEGFQDITSGNTDCVLSSATFSAQVEVLPFGTTSTKQFYISTSLLTAPPDNLWYDAIKSLLSEVIGVQDVIIDESENTLIIKSDRSRSIIIDGTYTAINLKVYLLIDYDINCKG